MALLRGEQVVLRAVEPTDAHALWRWHNDPEIMRWMHDPYPSSLAQVQKELADRPADNHAALTLMVEHAGRTVGIVALRGAEPESGGAELDIYLGEREVWGRGLGTDATRTVCRYGFDKMRLHRIGLTVAAGNGAAQRVYAKVGFVVEGRKREVFWRAGAWDDEVVMGLLSAELR